MCYCALLVRSYLCLLQFVGLTAATTKDWLVFRRKVTCQLHSLTVSWVSPCDASPYTYWLYEPPNHYRYKIDIWRKVELPWMWAWHGTVTCASWSCVKITLTWILILIITRIIFTTLSRDCGSLLFRRWFSWLSADSRRLRARRGWRGEYCECE